MNAIWTRKLLISIITGLTIEQIASGLHTLPADLLTENDRCAIRSTKGPEQEFVFTESPHTLEEDFNPEPMLRYAVSTSSSAGGLPVFAPYGWEEAANTVIRLANDRRRYHGHFVATFPGCDPVTV